MFAFLSIIVAVKVHFGLTFCFFPWQNEISLIKDETDVFDSLAQLGSIQLKVEEVHQRESAQYVLNFGCTVDLYVRMITSLKVNGGFPHQMAKNKQK